MFYVTKFMFTNHFIAIKPILQRCYPHRLRIVNKYMVKHMWIDLMVTLQVNLSQLNATGF